jgi:hypothetical protein
MAYGNKSNIPSVLSTTPAGVTATAGEINDLDGVTDGTVTASKAVVVDASKDVGTFGDVAAQTITLTQTARTATSDGLTTGIIADAGLFQYIAITSASANNIITLPTPTPGTTLIMYVGSNGCELRSDTPASVAIGGGTGASAESAIAADSLVFLVCTSATSWLGWDVAGATLAGVEAAA